jgi:hypothetical protein
MQELTLIHRACVHTFQKVGCVRHDGERLGGLAHKWYSTSNKWGTRGLLKD